MPKISVVIPTYNSAHFLGDAIRSVLAQTVGDFEIIVVDDGSTDNPKGVVDSFAERRLSYVYQENRGPAAAYNRGFKLCRGEYVIFLDADDVLLENALEKWVQVLDNQADVGFVYGQVGMMGEDGRVYRVRKSSFQDISGIVDRNRQIRELLFTSRITNSATLMRRRCVEEVGGFHEGLTYGEDRHLFMRLAKRYRAAYIAEPMITYRIHSGQLHKRGDPKVLEKAFLLILQEVFEDSELASQFQAWKGQAYSYCYWRVANSAYGKDMALARRYMRKAVKVYPPVLFRKDGLSIAYKYVASHLPNGLWQGLRNVKLRLVGSAPVRQE
jgi:glycosyltransferase involved in cell wall biosynthesis